MNYVSTRDQWTTLLTWETVPIDISYGYTITMIKENKSPLWELISKWSFICKNLSPFHTRMPCAKIDWNWLSVSGGGDFLKKVNICLLFRNYLPLVKGVTLHLNKLYWIHFTQESFVPNLVEISPGGLTRKIFKCRQNIFAILLSYPLEKRVAFHLNKLVFL